MMFYLWSLEPVYYIFLLYRHECFTGKYTTRKIHKNHIRELSHTWVYWWHNFGNFHRIFYRGLFVYLIKRTLHCGLKIWIIFSCGKNYILLTCCSRSWNVVLPLENKIYIFAPPCTVLYILLSIYAYWKLNHWIMQFLSSDWLSHHGIWAIISCTPNMVAPCRLS